MTKVVFLDIDNTLLDFSACVRDVMREGFSRFGLGTYHDWMYDVAMRITSELWARIEQGELALDSLEEMRWNLIFDELGIDFDGVVFEAFFKERLFWSAIPEPHAMELLDHLAGRYVLCAASNGPYEQQMNRLRTSGMLGYFRHVFVSSRVGAQKPSREFFRRCFDVLRKDDASLAALLPEEALIIGDSPASDIAGGAAFGMRTCLYQPEGRDGPHTEADYVISDLLDAKAFL